jgi:hypothetical protein
MEIQIVFEIEKEIYLLKHQNNANDPNIKGKIKGLKLAKDIIMKKCV